jgi:Acid Phosphatase
MILNFNLVAVLSTIASVTALARLSTMSHAVPKLVVFDLDMCVWSPEMFELDSAPRSWDRSTNTGMAKHVIPSLSATLSESRHARHN